MKIMRRDTFLFLCFFTCAIPAVFCQQAYVDSLRRVFLAEKDPVKKIDVFYQIANEQALDNPKLGFAYADSLEFMSKKAGYKKGLAMSKHLRGFAFDDQGEYEKALELFREELAIFIEIQDKDEISTSYTNLGSVWGNLGSSDSSIAYYLKSLALDEELGDSLGASILHNNIGNIYSDDGAYDKAIEHFEKALKIRQGMRAEKRYAQCYSNLATVYSRKKDYAKAEEYGLKALAFAEKYDQKSLAGIIANSHGSNLNDQKRYGEAIPWLNKSLDYFKALGNEPYQTYPLYNLVNAYAGLGNGDKALQVAKEGYAIVEKLKLEHQYELYFKAFAAAFEAQGNYAQALDWHKKYVVLVDSILKLDNTKKVAQMEAQFETQKKEARLAQQQLELERQSNQKRNILVGSIVVLLALG
ncbi:MAG: tetratricopeptide repeat protein, partial [Bacteroidota bacterium]